jgi:hypothetical protein
MSLSLSEIKSEYTDGLCRHQIIAVANRPLGVTRSEGLLLWGHERDFDANVAFGVDAVEKGLRNGLNDDSC